MKRNYFSSFSKCAALAGLLLACSRENGSTPPQDSSRAAAPGALADPNATLELNSAVTWEVARTRPVRVTSQNAEIVVGYVARGNDIVCRHAEACRCELPWPLTIAEPGKNPGNTVQLELDGVALSCDPCTRICPLPPGPARLSGELDLAASVLRLAHPAESTDGSKLEPTRVEHPRAADSDSADSNRAN